MTMTIKPFQNEEESLTIDDLTIENRLDRIEMYGSVQITKDKVGLQLARELQQVLDATVKALQAEKDLPDQVRVTPPDNVKNPFGS
jgi:hypothetical protein